MTKEDQSYLNVNVPTSKMEYGADYQERMAIWDELWSPESKKVLPNNKKAVGTNSNIKNDKALLELLKSWKTIKINWWLTLVE